VTFAAPSAQDHPSDSRAQMPVGLGEINRCELNFAVLSC